MNYLSLFSGVEAATVAWEPLGLTCVGLSEISPFPSAVLAHHYPTVKNFGDVTKITKEVLNEQITKDINIIIGGSPCQSFSLAGARRGTADPRGQLMYEYLRVISEVRPNYIVWENVKGVFSSSSGNDFGTLLGTLSNLGYDLEWQVYDTRDFGTPQSRNRVYVIGHLRTHGSPTILPNSKRHNGGRSSSPESGPCSSTHTDFRSLVTETKTVHVGRNVVGCLAARDYKGIGTDCAAAGKVVMEELNSGEVLLRRLTPREYERLQGFPDDYTRIPWRGKDREFCPDGHRYKAMGNTMSVPVVEWIGKQLLAHNNNAIADCCQA